ncbi:GDSL-type esterase/lipase family protein [Paenibacillus sp. MBLB4367]|uniref:GDSL-type esterase/lipase family protein n=1 Tax=Paenibacillus sp. MBLB4367 TaxID=3384767 RepID=UPI0039082256
MVKQKTKKSFLFVIILLVTLISSLGFLATFMGASTIRHDNKIKGNDIRVAAVGDNITYGFGVVNWYKKNYPITLQNMLGIGYNVKNFGYSGRTAMTTGDNPYVDEKIYQKSLNYLPNIVVIMFGTNDSKVQNWKSKEEFKEQYRKLLLSYTQLESKPVVYLCTPATPYYVNGKTEGPMKFNIQKDKVDEVVEAGKELAEELDLIVIDINEVTKNHRQWFIKDGIHPNADGAKAIANAVYDAIAKG